MKVPFPANNSTINRASSKTATASANHTSIAAESNRPIQPAEVTAGSYTYEPKSVLELRGSPSPGAEKPGVVTGVPLQLEEDHHHVLINPQLEDWDSWMRELGLNDESSPVTKQFPQVNLESEVQIDHNQYQNLPEFPPPVGSFDAVQFPVADFGLLPDIWPYAAAAPLGHDSNAINPFQGFSGGDLNSGNWNVGLDYVDELIRLAECFETNSVQLGHVILTRLNERLRSPAGKALQRAAFYFKEALQSILANTIPTNRRPASSSEIIQAIKAQKIFSSISPIPMFSSFTANQALLEAMDGASRIHAVDFDIGFGGHWASYMKELADKAESHKSALPELRISAVVPEGYEMESNLIRENLDQFARELNIRFEVDFISVRSFEYLSFKAIKFMEGERVAILLSPAIFRQVGASFLNDLRRVSPQLVLYADIEGHVGYCTPSYRQAVIYGLEFYSTLLESLEAANINGAGGVGSDWIRRIETFVLYPKILEGIEAVGRRDAAGREALVAAGLRPVALSQFADFQAECLLRRVQVRGFHVIKRQAEMLLCWHDRPLVATSAWRY